MKNISILNEFHFINIDDFIATLYNYVTVIETKDSSMLF